MGVWRWGHAGRAQGLSRRVPLRSCVEGVMEGGVEETG